MWLIFGLASIFLLISWQFYKKLYIKWNGEYKKLKGIDYEYLISRNKDKEPEKFFLGVNCIYGNNFRLKYETEHDQFYKKLGLSNEVQTNMKEFDDKVYVISDNEDLNKFFIENNEIKSNILELFRPYDQYDCYFKEIRLFKGQLWIEFKVKSKFDDEKRDSITEIVIPILEKIKENLKVSKLKKNNLKNDPFFYKSMLLLSVSAGMFFAGLLYLFRRTFQEVPFNIDDMYKESMFLGIALLIFLIAFTIGLLRGSSRAHLVLFETITLGAVGSFLCAYMLFSDLNMAFDDSKEKIFSVKVSDKYKSSSKRSTSYYLYLENWTEDKEKTKKIQVSSGDYSRFSIGQKIKVYQHDGYFNKRWIEKLTK